MVLDGQGRLFQRHAIGKFGPRLEAVDHSLPYQLQRERFHRDLHRVYIVYDFVYLRLTKSAHHDKIFTVHPSIEVRLSYYVKCKKMYEQRRIDGTDHLHRSVEGIWELALPVGSSACRFHGDAIWQLPSAICRKSPKLLGAFLGEKEQKKAVFGGSSIYRTSSPFISQYIFRKISARTFRKCMGLQVLDQI